MVAAIVVPNVLLATLLLWVIVDWVTLGRRSGAVHCLDPNDAAR